MVSLFVVVPLAILVGELSRAQLRLRSGKRSPTWCVVAGLAGAFPLIVSAEGAGQRGIALLTVALVAGQVLGGLFIDASGVSPGGARRITGGRVAGATCHRGDRIDRRRGTRAPRGGSPRARRGRGRGLGAGATIALLGAATGHLSTAFASPLIAAATMFATSAVAALGTWLVATSGRLESGLHAPIEQWVVGGILGAVVTTVVARVVASLGVFHMTLALVAGQTLGAIAIDLVSPASERTITATTLAGLVLVHAAVVMSSRPARVPHEAAPTA